ncbi:arginyltransferase [Congregibacter litoralis]|uniref:Aspartate/glutamate leucyltransferase n=1 Tax=Congregibacter litoralis KT71 TaxID=314285 RepID=A4A3B4_9GAMM|nr:arginyltransferase [Congregibacter litoralis]EAQ99187.1 putative arginyl-tRNA:protein arginylyltransferase [Congregibacter litoralis KT71]
MTSSLRDLKVYTTYPHRCSYLEEEEATTLFIDPRQSVDQTLYSNLSMLGFRRSGNHIYRPHCSHCNACIPARVHVNDFKANRSQRRCLKRNRDLEVTIRTSVSNDESYALYDRYIRARHADGDMYPPDRDQFESFLNNPWDCTEYCEFRAEGRLVAVAVVDMMLDGLSAIYTFFDPDETTRSLGRYAVLWQIERSRSLGLPYVYLGYWIRNCDKMSYKSDYQPLELLINNQWQRSTEGLIETF